MLKDLKLLSHTFEELYDKAKSLGNISSVEEIHENKPKKSLLIVSIIVKSGYVRDNECWVCERSVYSMRCEVSVMYLSRT